MKKILIMSLVLGACFFVIACGNNGKEVILNHEEIMKGNLSSISGEYVNSEGDVIYLEPNFQERLINDVRHGSDKYYLNVRTDDGMFGVLLIIYPVGVDVNGWDRDYGDVIFETDVSKVRIYFGHDLPMSGEEIFTRMED